MTTTDLDEIRDRLALARLARRQGKPMARLFHLERYLQLRSTRNR